MIKDRACQKRSVLKGFSIIEVTTIIAVIGILVVLGMPQLSRYSAERELKGTASLFASTLDFARTEAVKFSSAVRINYDENTKTITVARIINGGPAQQLKALTLPGRVSFQTRAFSFEFQPNGTILDQQNLVLTSQGIEERYEVLINTLGAVSSSKVSQSAQSANAPEVGGGRLPDRAPDGGSLKKKP